jgi:hypothetical protein
MGLSPGLGRTYHGWWRVAVAAGLVALGLAGCGASYQAVYEGEVRFEHCYRLDEEPGIPLTQQRECWREWTRFYTYGQTRDRLEYALRRQRELTTQIENPGAELVEAPRSDLAASEPVAAPPPTSPFAPPPHVHNGKPPTTATPEAVELLDMLTSGKQPAAQSCILTCFTRWQPCIKTCDAKNEVECRQGCDAAFKACGQRCFEK